MQVFVVFLFLTSFLSASPKAVYLTLSQDPAHSMSVHWIEKDRAREERSLLYQKEGDLDWKKAEAFSKVPLDETTYCVTQCLIDDLEESSYYTFYFEGGKERYLFKTLPSTLDQTLKIVVGGDFTESFPMFRKMNRAASKTYPDCAILGGDIAYACGKGLFPGKHGYLNKWITFFKQWQETMKGDKGQMIPVAAVVGNHDVTSKDRKKRSKDAFFLTFFPSAQDKTYKSIELAGSISLFLLDTGHLFPIARGQTLWLEEALKKQMRWKIPIYHLAGYPSTHSVDDRPAFQVRTLWIPLFEKYGVKLALEHHNHAFKRTYPMLGGKIDPSGIVYIGDGCWGSPPRKELQKASYLEKSGSFNHFSLVTVAQDRLQVDIFNQKNELIDTWKTEGL